MDEMLFHVRMDVNLPPSMPEAEAAELKKVEKAQSQALQRDGKWRHLWRIAGQYSNVSLFDVESVDELHQLVSTLPLFPYMKIEVTPLCRHPSSIREDDR
jgi:muconolactone D-isomerase